MAIKKVFNEIMTLLNESADLQVADILEEATAICSAKVGGGRDGTSFVLSDSGEVVEIFCYYHKKWEPLELVEYSKKAGTASGYASMCKEGVHQWTKQQNVAKKETSMILDNLQAGLISAEDIDSIRADIEASRKVIVPRSDGIGRE